MLVTDSATWIAVGLAAAAVVVALVFAAVVVLTLRRRPRVPAGPPERVESGQLARALQEARDDTARARELAEISASIDLDTVLDRALQAAASMPGVDAAMVVLPNGGSAGDSQPLVATTGMSSEEAARQPVSGPQAGQPARAVRIAYSYTSREAEGNQELIRGGLSLPLKDERDETIGTLAVFWGASTARRRTGRSRSWKSSPLALGPQSRTRGGFARRSSSPISTR